MSALYPAPVRDPATVHTAFAQFVQFPRPKREVLWLTGSEITGELGFEHEVGADKGDVA
jgi:hypothetical protein